MTPHPIVGVFVGLKEGKLYGVLYDDLGCEYLLERTGDGWEFVAFKTATGFESELRERQLSPDPAEVMEGLLSQGEEGIVI